MVRLSFCLPSLRDCCHVINGGARSIEHCPIGLPGASWRAWLGGRRDLRRAERRRHPERSGAEHDGVCPTTVTERSDVKGRMSAVEQAKWP